MNDRIPELSRRTPWSSLLAFVCAALVFLAFVGYATIAPTTFRATAQIILTPIGEKPLTLPTLPPPAERLREAALSQESLERATKDLGFTGGTDSHGSLHRHIAEHIEVQSTSSTTFDVSFKSATAAEAQKNATYFGRLAAAQAVRVLAPATVDPTVAREAARAEAAAELARFMGRHPELTPEPSVTPVPSNKPAPDPDLSSLRAERDQLQAKLARLPNPTAANSDNPFGDPTASSAEATRLRRRMIEIDQTLSTRRRAEKKAEEPPKVTPEVDREWKKLLRAVAEPKVPATPASEVPFGVMLREAGMPPRPISPDRRLLGIAGILTSLVTAIIILAIQSSRRRRLALEASAARALAEAQRPPSEPPRPISDYPPRPFGEHPRPGSDPPRPGSDPPPGPRNEPARPGSDPPYPIIQVGRRSSKHPELLGPAGTITTAGHTVPERPSPPPAAQPSPPPPAPTAEPSPAPPEVPVQPSPSPPETARGGIEAAPAAPVVAKGTLVGMAPLDPRLLASAESSADEAVAANQEARPTLRPPPDDSTSTTEITGGPTDKSASNRPAPAETPGQSAPPADGDDWTGPSRAHRRSGANRRTTQMLGSAIAPVVRRRSDAPEPDRSSTPTPQPKRSPTGYSFRSEPPEEAPRRAPVDTPPYYQVPKQSPSHRPRPPSTPQPPVGASRPLPQRARITKQAVRPGWTPHPALDPTLRRDVADQIFPLAVESCFVLGVTSVSEARAHKARIAAELAMALAEPRSPRILLLEADFQWPVVHEIMRADMPMSMGFSQQLRVRQSDPASWTVVECNPTLHVLAEGIMRSPGLILSVQFEEGIRSLRTYYDVIVLHGPDTSAEVECRALASVVDGYAIVAPTTGSPELGRTVDLFPNPRFSTIIGV